MKGNTHKTFIIFTLAFITGVFFQFSIDRRPVSEQEFVFKPSLPPFYDNDENWSDSVYQTMSISEKFGQLFMVAAYPKKGKSDTRRVTELIKKHNIGGIIFFQGEPEEVAQLARYYQSVSKVPLLIAIDGEWGPSMRLNNTIVYPRQMMLGAIDDNEILYQMGRDIGKQLKLLGIHVNFAPVIDVNCNPDNPVINSRSFGENRENAARKGILYMRGMQDEGIIAVAKHFPGHGDTDEDSHYTLPLLQHNNLRLDSIELFPFKALIESGVGGIMTAHLHIPHLDSTANLPATLSPFICDSLLKKQLKFKGLVFTDAMNMKGVTLNFEPIDANIMALFAGNDIILMPADVDKTIERLIRMAEIDDTLEQKLSSRCKKILQAKAWSVLPNLQTKPLDNKTLIDSLNSPHFELIRRKLIEKSLTVINNTNNLIPLKNLESLRIAAISIGGSPDNEFQQTLSLYSSVDKFHVSDRDDSLQLKQLIDTLNSYNLIVLSLHSNDQRATHQFGVSDKMLAITDTLLSRQPIVASIFANPYILRRLKHIENNAALLMAYDNDPAVQSLAAQLLFGAIPAEGRLPVSINTTYRIGRGYDTKAIQRLKYTIPLEAGFDNKALVFKIDSLVENAIHNKAMPGCQVFVAKDGKVVLHKSYGYHTYTHDREVKNTDLYDVASITKIAATVPSLMLLEQKNTIDLGKPVSNYLSELDTTNKSELKIVDILLHQAGLKSWIPFYQSTVEPLYPGHKFASDRYSKQYPYRIAKKIYVNKNLKYKDNFYSQIPDENYTIKVADKLYMTPKLIDSMYHAIYSSNLSRYGKYVYSDIGFYLFHQMIENLIKQELDEFVNSVFYAPLGAQRLTYNPLEKYSPAEIVPTENDMIFRKQLLHGYVHDPGAAILGGVAGHAGLFSNANDLAKYMQMLLNGGRYGGREYLSEKLIEKYTSCMECLNGNRRGLGFDKPENNASKNGPTFSGISSVSYGHTGFTGTMAWADPATGILFIFLSNRVYPDAYNNKLLEMNVRKNIQKAIYDSLLQ